MALIEAKEIRKEYKAGEVTVQALCGVDLTIEDGEFTSIAGPSGSGKTTLLNLIGCLDKPTSGRLLVGGKSVTDSSKNELSDLRLEKIGFVFQTFNLIPVLTAKENVAFALTIEGKRSSKEIDERAMAMLREVGLAGMENRRPGELSGGQQQRVAVARALVKEPKLILADEPTANLDSKTGEELIRLMEGLNKKKNITFLFSTHDKMVMDHARRLILLHDGQIAKDERR
jgi:putative ABC transport system ATP-binding protein